MNRKISRWGIGPRIIMWTGTYAIVAGLTTIVWPKICLISVVPSAVFRGVGIILLIIGIPMFIVAAKVVRCAYNSDDLATTGIFGIVRNPIYSAWIVFITPGLMLFTHSWPLLLTPLIAYIIFKAAIWRESEYLEKRFGEDYRRYKTQVSELLPFHLIRLVRNLMLGRIHYF